MKLVIDGKSKNLAPSLDRIVPKKGYIKGNLIIVSDIVNRMKQDSTLEDMEKILKYYTKLLKKIFDISNLNNKIKLND